MTQMIGPVNAWPCSVDSIAWTEDQPHLVVDLLSTSSAKTIERHIVIPLAPDDAWQLVLMLQEALERKGIARPRAIARGETEQ